MYLHLGCGDIFLNGFVNSDIAGIPNIDRVLDLRQPLPYDDGSVDLIVCNHTLEIMLFREVPFAMQEIHRVLKTDGWARFHFGAEKLALTGMELGDILRTISRGEWTVHGLDKMTTMTGNDEILKAKGQHGPSVVIEMQKK